jgi:hypothetical protein
MRTNILIISRSFLRMTDVSDKSCRENKNTHFVFNNVFFFESSVVCEIKWKKKKYCRTGQATDDNMTQADCMLDTYGYRLTLRICNTCRFSTATIIAWMRLNCLSCHKTYFSVNRTASLTTVPCAVWISATVPSAVITWSGSEDQNPVLNSPDYLSVLPCGTSYISCLISFHARYCMAFTVATSSLGYDCVIVDCWSAWSPSLSGLLRSESKNADDSSFV